MANQYINAMSALWNSGGTTYSAIKMNVTNAASATGSMLLQLQVGAVDKFFVDKIGNINVAGAVTAAGANFSAPALPSANDSAALGSAALSWSDLFLATGGVINWSAGDVTITHSSNLLTFGGAANGYAFDAVIKPAADDGAALGAIGATWSDLFLATGAVVNFGGGDVTVTHSTDLLTVGGGDVRVASPGTDAQSVVTIGATQTLTAKTMTSPVLNTPTINGATLTGTINGGTYAGATLTSPTINAPTVSNGTFTGTASMAAVTASGAVSGSSITASGGNFIGTTSAAVLGTALSASGTVYLRPNGYNVAANQTTIDAGGNMAVQGAVSAADAGAFTNLLSVSGANAQLRTQPTSGTGYIGILASDGSAWRLLMYAAGASAGTVSMAVAGSYTYQFDASGGFHAAACYAGTAFLQNNGNVQGSVWTNFAGGAYSDAYSAIYTQIEQRGQAWANDRVAQLQFRKVSLGFNGTSGGFSNLGAGTVIVGYAREAGVDGQVSGLYYATLQAWDPVRGWVSFQG